MVTDVGEGGAQELRRDLKVPIGLESAARTGRTVRCSIRMMPTPESNGRNR